MRERCMAFQTLSIDVTKLDKTLFYKGAKGTYLNLVIFENQDGEDQYGNHGVVKQSTPKDDRQRKMPILGNSKNYGDVGGSTPAPAAKDDGGDDIPF